MHIAASIQTFKQMDVQTYTRGLPAIYVSFVFSTWDSPCADVPLLEATGIIGAIQLGQQCNGLPQLKVNAKTTESCTALSFALDCTNEDEQTLECVRLLLEAKADVPSHHVFFSLR